jgi:hypothetical protein
MSKQIKKKYWYLQDWGTYNNQTPVFVGYTIKEITAIIKKQGWNKEVTKKWCDESEELEKFMEGKNGSVWSYEGWSLMYLPHWHGTWDEMETLVHECFHLVIEQLGKQKAFINGERVEEEGMAYQQEYLFRSIRRKLASKMMK